MTDNFRLNFGVSLSVLAFSCFEPSQSLAQTCTVPPTCESMGYNKTASQCGNLATLKCPFDETKLFCTAFTDSEGNSIMAVGDILYSDGSFSTEPIANKKPIGVIFDISGMAVATKSALTDTAYQDSDYDSKFCSKYTDYNVTGWKAPNIYQITAIYNNKDIIDTKLAKIIAASQLGTNKLGYNNNSDTSYMDFSNGKTGIDSYSRENWKLHCVLDRETINATPITPDYTPGQAYTDTSGIARGTVLSVDASGKHGIVISSVPKTGTKTEATTYCDSYNSGTLNWYIPSKKHMEQACQLNISGFSSNSDYWVSDDGYISFINCQSYTYTSTSGTKTYFCVASF